MWGGEGKGAGEREFQKGGNGKRSRDKKVRDGKHQFTGGERFCPPPSAGPPVHSYISFTSFAFLKTHLLMEPFCVILKRAMASKHPLHQVLRYHCRDVTIPNSVGTPALIDEGNYMDQLFAFGSEGTTRLLEDAHKIATWEVTDFRGELKVRC